MAKTERKYIIPNKCLRELSEINGKITMKFKNTKSCKIEKETMQDYIDAIKVPKIIIK